MDSVAADSFAGLVALALERMAFVVTEPAAEPAAHDVLGACVAHAIVDLRGSENYTLAVGATPEMVREIASGMMGVEPEEIEPGDHGRATVDELANVLAGELVMLLTGGDDQVRSTLPHAAAVADVAALLGGDGAGGLRAVFSSNGGHLVVVVAPAPAR